jgi:PAS domain S-box-containing protein
MSVIRSREPVREHRCRRDAVGLCLLVFFALAETSWPERLLAQDADAGVPQALPDTLRVAVLRDWPPHYRMLPDGTVAGFAVDVTEAVAGRTGFHVRFVPFPSFTASIQALRDGEVDVIPDFGVTPSRAEEFAFTRPYEAFRVSIFTRRSETTITTAADLAGRRVAVVASNVAIDLVPAVQPDARTVLYQDPREALFDLLAAGVDAMAYPEEVLSALARSVGVEDRLRTLPTPLVEIQRAMGMRRADTLLTVRLDAGVRDLVGSPEYAEIYRRWLGQPESFWTVRRVAFAGGLLLGLVLLGMAAWRYRSVSKLARALSHSVRERDAEHEARLREAERFRQIAERIHDVFWISAAGERRLEYVSPAFGRIWGMPREDLYEDQDQWIAAVHPADRQAVLDSLPAQLLGESEREYRIVRSDGQVRWIWDRTYPVRDRGQVDHVVGVARDITDRVAAEEAVKTSERRFRAFVENASDLISTLDADGNMGYQSAPLPRLLGYGPGELEGCSIFEYVHPEDVAPVREAWRSMLASPGAAVRVGVFRFRHRNGSWRTLDATLTNLLHDPAVGAVLSNARDVTEQEELERQLRQAQKLEAVGRLAGGIAHDFNNLLTVIRAQTDLMLSETGVPEGISDEIELVQAAASRAAELTGQLLAFSRDQVLRPRVVDLASVLRRISKLLARVIGEDVEMVLDLPEGGPSLEVDRARLEQVVMNLAVNARDAMPGGGSLTLRTYEEEVDARKAEVLGGLPAGRYAVLEVADTGVGMDEDTQRRVFEPFFTTKPKGEGTGLGLAMAYGFVTQSGGHIHLHSEPGAGATFVLRFPVVAAAPEADEPSRPLSPPPRTTASGTVLLIEDDPSVRRVTEKLLVRAGFEVRAHPDGESAFADLESGLRVDVVLTDLVLPGIGGRAVLERIRARWSGLPVVVMSGYAGTSPGHPGGLPPEVPFVQKPFAADDLVALLRSVLKRR